MGIFATWEFKEGILEIMSELNLEKLRHTNLEQKFRMGFQAEGKGALNNILCIRKLCNSQKI